MEELAVVLAEVFGSKVRNDGSWLHTLVYCNEGCFNARVRNDPLAEIFVTPRALDGFELTLRGERIRPDDTFENALTLSTNDHELARIWLDSATRKMVIDSAYEYASAPESYLDGLATGMMSSPPGLSTRRIWTYELANDELIASKGNVELQPDRMAIALETASTIAARTRRWAAEYSAIAKQVGGKLHPEVELGGTPLIVSNRAAVDVSLQLLRRLPGEKTGRLRTLISAKRVGLHDERSFSLVERSARRTMVPPLPDGSRKDFGIEDYRMRATADVELDDLAHKQLLAARPAAVIADLDSIDIWYDSAPQDASAIDAAFALAAHLAIGNAKQQGPYR